MKSDYRNVYQVDVQSRISSQPQNSLKMIQSWFAVGKVRNPKKEVSMYRMKAVCTKDAKLRKFFLHVGNMTVSMN